MLCCPACCFSACPVGLGGHPAGWWAGAVVRRGFRGASLRPSRKIRLGLFFSPLPRAYWPIGPFRFEVCERPAGPPADSSHSFWPLRK
eukprot:10103881-Alexandrium_andersonii.AAC.1